MGIPSERFVHYSQNEQIVHRSAPLETPAIAAGLTAMASNPAPGYPASDLARRDVDALQGPVVLDFGTSWCGVCRRTAPLVDDALARHPAVRHLRIEDGPGRRLGRSFRVKLWPTLVFLRDGGEVDRLVRPHDAEAIVRALTRIDPR